MSNDTSVRALIGEQPVLFELTIPFDTDNAHALLFRRAAELLDELGDPSCVSAVGPSYDSLTGNLDLELVVSNGQRIDVPTDYLPPAVVAGRFERNN